MNSSACLQNSPIDEGQARSELLNLFDRSSYLNNFQGLSRPLSKVNESKCAVRRVFTEFRKN